ncbi:MAG: hypothetical protein IPO97_11095 [Sphingomonadales bacterium]|nr:hypothetical protein [Sphingomonadales bacterium]
MAPKRNPILPSIVGDTDGEITQLRADAAAGLELRLGRISQSEHQVYRDRLAFELDVITSMGFAAYFLIVADFIKWAKEQGIPVGPGRGSGAGSVVAWSLTITDLDPIKLGLLFERFLNPERVSMPDFDIDFCETRREEVIRYVQAKYGRDQVAPDHHLRAPEGACCAEGYGPRPPDELWTCRPAGQARAQSSDRPLDA